jgi:hypothetical protein
MSALQSKARWQRVHATFASKPTPSLALPKAARPAHLSSIHHSCFSRQITLYNNKASPDFRRGQDSRLYLPPVGENVPMTCYCADWLDILDYILLTSSSYLLSRRMCDLVRTP